MNIERRPDGWWIVDVPDTIDQCGPYATKADAEKDRVGLARFFRHENDRSWICGEGPAVP
jgi:hypothetical protein